MIFVISNNFLTYKPAIITFLYHLNSVSFSELQLVWILGFVVVNSFVSKIENAKREKKKKKRSHPQIHQGFNMLM